MTDDVKRPRPYRSERRAVQAAETRLAILAAAGKLFRERGYAATSLPALAADAGVAVETIYRGFGSKANLFKAVVEAAVAGGAARSATPVEERPAIRAVIEEPDPRRALALYAATQPGIHRRSGPLLRVLRDAAAGDRDLRRLWDELETLRLNGQGRFAGMLAERGALRPDLDIEGARDIVWTLCSLAVYDLLVGERGWTEERYLRWLTAALTSQLLAG